MRDADAIAELKRLLPECLLPDQVRLGAQLARGLQAARAGRRRALPLERWLARARASIVARQRRAGLAHRVSYPEELPITARKDEIVAALRERPVVVVAGETGSGKTTQLPKMCLEAGWGARARIGCTQPRRVAALSISRRIAEELRVGWGREVGCKIRFTDRTRPETAIKILTDGMLLAELQGDPLLSEYEAIILDEAHERSLNIDFLIGCLKRLLEQRRDLKLVITSATIDTRLFAEAFGGAPVIEVSGRLYPVEVRHRPLDHEAEERGELTYTEAAAATVAEIAAGSPEGDLLVFMPGERDIRETCDLIAVRHGERLEVVPLFGRLSAAEQQRVFAPGPRRRVVVATNVAETSLTVPRIRYVVDSGLARISRYHAGTRGQRLPIEPISQSSARQRQGRCGRLSGGVCIRLYSEEDFAARPPFTEPEIQRCNLADVILRMKAFALGEIESFPFLEPPPPAAIRGAYALLRELGALDEARALTPLGRELARLPVDPAIGRMILEARAENCLTEVLVIAAGLSIQDPRERPFEQREAAAAAHRRFQDARSDFLTLLNIWNAFHDTWESLKTQSQLRKFCRAHFLAYLRMREWVDLHGQIADALADLEGFTPNREPAEYAAIHRAVLTGLFGHVGRREDRNLYRTAGDRLVHVFPGSGLFLKGRPPQRGRRKKATEPPPEKETQPAWVVAGELVETSRSFARTLAAIEPEWIIELAPHLLRTTHARPRWDPRSGRVVATEQIRLRGLLLRERVVGYRDLNPAAATEIFIREALLGDEPDRDETPSDATSAPARPRDRSRRGAAEMAAFLDRNRQTLAKIELWQTRLQARVVPDLEEALFRFYADRLAGVASWADLRRRLRELGGPRALCAQPADLLGEHADAFEAGAFPDRISVGRDAVPVRYAYAPGEAHDGLTVRLAAPLAEVVDAALLDWAVPALREARILALLHALPKSLRRPLLPLRDTARVIAREVPATGADYLARVSEYLRRERGVDVPSAAWRPDEIPTHLRPRIEIVGEREETLAAGRDLGALRARLRQSRPLEAGAAWRQAVARWERYDVRDWTFGDPPEHVPVADVAGFPLRAWPGLQLEGGAVHLRLFRHAAEARAASPLAVGALAARVLERELAWLRKDLRSLRESCALYVTVGSGEELVETAWGNLYRHYFGWRELWPLREAAFRQLVEQVRGELRGVLPRLAGWVQAILEKRQQILLGQKSLRHLQAEVDALVPARFLDHVPFARLPHLVRYLRALQVRAERAARHPQRDAERAGRLRPYRQTLQRYRAAAARNYAVWREWDRLRWQVEEFKVSLFAQELGTAEPVSEKRLDRTVAALLRAAQENAPRA